MKILVLSDGMGQDDARGTEIISETLSKLARSGTEVTAITTFDHFRDPLIFDKWKKTKEREGLKVVVIDLSWLTRQNRYVALWLAKILTSFKAIEVLQKERPDILHEYSSSPFLFFRTFLVSLFGSARTVHTIITYNNKFLSKPFWAIFGNLLSKVIVPSQGFAQGYSQFLNANKIEVISQGVDVNHFANAKPDPILFGIPKNKKVILFLGPPEKGKGLFLLLETVKTVLKKKPNCFFLFVFHRKLYKNEYKKALDEVRKTFKAHKDTFKIIESLVNVPTLLKSVDVVTIPQTIHHGTLIYPQTLLEAMAAGKVAVVSGTKEIKEIVKDGGNGFLFKNNNSKELAKAIIKALNAPKSVGIAAQKEIEGFHSLDRTIEKLDILYKELI